MTTPSPALCDFVWKRGDFEKLSLVSESLDMTSYGFGGMFGGDFADMSANTIPLVSMVPEQRV